MRFMTFWLQRAAARAAVLTVAVVLSGCTEPPFGTTRDPDRDTNLTTSDDAVTRDVEAPDVFDIREAGLWDGRPSLGGVWVAHPDVTEPERVLIRNTSNDETVVGALFRRERDMPGPRLMVSSDAAVALDLLAGAPAELRVTALRREPVPNVAPEPKSDPEQAATDPQPAPAPEPQVAEATLPPAETVTDPQTADVEVARASEKPAPALSPFGFEKRLVEVADFPDAEAAEAAATEIRDAGMAPVVMAETEADEPAWRVVVGPAETRSDRNQLMRDLRAAGFRKARAVRE